MIVLLGTWFGRRRAPGACGRVRPGRDVLAVECEGVAVLLDLRRDRYFGLDEVGTLVWREIERGGGAAEAAERICAEYDATAELAQTDAERLIGELVAQGLAVHA
jgi:hypothetical protein